MVETTTSRTRERLLSEGSKAGSKATHTERAARPVGRRRWPRWHEIGPMLDLSIRRPSRERALQYCADVQDVRALARRRVPRMVFDFVDGAAGSESSLSRARDVFSRIELEPRALRDVRQVDLTSDLLGRSNSLPIFFAPTGATRLMHHAGEPAVARVASRTGIPYSLSTLGTTTLEDLAAAVPTSRRWFQLYLMSDRSIGREMTRRAWDAGYDTLLLTIDTPVPGRRNRDVRNGLIVPPRLTWRNVADIARHPRWGINAVTTEPMRMAMVDAESELPAARMAKVFDPGVSSADVEWLRKEWPGKLVVKGVQSLDDARLAASLGVDAVELSSHGGRQLEHAPLPFELLPAVRDSLDPSVQVLVDGGVLSGVDVIACLANGADAVGIGRAYLYGLMAAGEQGVQRITDLIRAEIEATVRLLGCTSIKELRDVPVRVRERQLATIESWTRHA